LISRNELASSLSRFSFAEVIRTHAERSPEALCFVINGRRITWFEFERSVARATSRITGLLGAARDQRVALRIDDPYDFLIALFALVTARFSVVPLPARGSVEAIGRIIADCKPVASIVDAGNLASLSSVQCSQVLSAEMVTGGDSNGDVEARDHDLRATRLDREMTVLYSSGTTDHPKGVIHSERGRLLLAARVIREYEFSRRTRSLITAPIYAPAALSPIFAEICAGGASIVMGEFSAQGLIECVKRDAPTCFHLTPTQFLMLFEEREFSGKLLSACDFVQCGGAPLDGSLRSKLFAEFPDNFVEGYGTTETEGISRLPRRAPIEKRGSVGLPVSDMTVFVLGEGDERLKSGEVGEIVVSSPANLLGYVGVESADVFWTDRRDGRRFYRTGDLGWLDEDGFLWLEGRKKDMIITGGINVYPRDIERVLLQHPAVREAAVVAMPSEILGETPLAFVVLRREQGQVTSRDLCQWANARLGASQKVYNVNVLESLPKNEGGKTMKVELRAFAERSRRH
jgi:long-chain acyl-CoA synthetase